MIGSKSAGTRQTLRLSGTMDFKETTKKITTTSRQIAYARMNMPELSRLKESKLSQMFEVIGSLVEKGFQVVTIRLEIGVVTRHDAAQSHCEPMAVSVVCS